MDRIQFLKLLGIAIVAPFIPIKWSNKLRTRKLKYEWSFDSGKEYGFDHETELVNKLACDIREEIDKEILKGILNNV